MCASNQCLAGYQAQTDSFKQIKCLSISKDKASKDYILVMNYASNSCLCNNLFIIVQMNWKRQINYNLLHQIFIYFIHMILFIVIYIVEIYYLIILKVHICRFGPFNNI